MGRKVTRRGLAATFVAVPLAAQAPASPAKDSPEELLRAARENQQRSADQLTKYKLRIETEPAFHFKP